MPEYGFPPDPKHQIKNSKKKQKKAVQRFDRRKNFIEEAIRLVAFENTIASRIQEEDITQAFSLYKQTQKKIIKSKINKDYFS